MFYPGQEHFSAGDELVKNAHSNFSTHAQLATCTSDFQTNHVEIIATHLRKWAVSPSRTHLSTLPTCYAYAIAFSVALNGLQVKYVDR